MARHRRVVFVDADRAGAEPFRFGAWRRAAGGPGFSSHSVDAAARCSRWPRICSAPTPEAWLLGIRGYEFDEFGEGLSRPGARNLAAAAALRPRGARRRRVPRVPAAAPTVRRATAR